jgi:hypothetical protein
MANFIEVTVVGVPVVSLINLDKVTEIAQCGSGCRILFDYTLGDDTAYTDVINDINYFIENS